MNKSDIFSIHGSSIEHCKEAWSAVNKNLTFTLVFLRPINKKTLRFPLLGLRFFSNLAHHRLFLQIHVIFVGKNAGVSRRMRESWQL